MKTLVRSVAGLIVASLATHAQAAGIAVGAAPKGNATTVATRIIKYNFPSCRRVSSAVRGSDGSIRARCDQTNYLVFTVFNPKEGRAVELALNCTAAKDALNVSC